MEINDDNLLNVSVIVERNEARESQTVGSVRDSPNYLSHTQNFEHAEADAVDDAQHNQQES